MMKIITTRKGSGILKNFVLILILIVLITIIIMGYIIYKNIRNKVRQVSNLIFETEDIIEGIQNRETLVENTPKSISGMESIEAPRLQEDFPELSLEELKSRNVDGIYEFYDALKNEDLGKFANYETLNAQLKEMIEKKREEEVEISKVHVHKQAMRNYRKSGDTATVTFQVAFEYTKTDPQHPEGKKTQERATTKWVYRLDDTNFGMEASASKSCPNCGAPLTTEGVSTCPYCMSNIKVDYLRTWNFTSIVID